MLCRPAKFALFLMLFVVDTASAQGRSHGYFSLGAGATDIVAGLDWLISTGPIGVGGEYGLGQLGLISFNGSYHPLARVDGRIDPFATMGIMSLGSSERSLTGLSIGGGVTLRVARRVGLRLDGFKFLTLSSSYDVPPERRTSVDLWGIRGGLAFGFW